MSNEAAERVSRLMEECARVERESETVYLALGRLFPRLSEEMQRSADQAERSLKGFASILSGAGSGSAGEGGIGEMRGFVRDSSAFFRSMHERDKAFLGRINDSIERLGSLDSVILRVRSDSEDMEIISLNAMTVALKSGGEGKAFSVITDELKRLSGQTIDVTEAVTELGRSMLDVFHRLRGFLSELDALQSGLFASLEESLSRGFSDVEAEALEAGRFFGELMARARGVKEPVLRVMNEVQLQDIIRQSLQHVGISLSEARAAASSPGGDPAFVAAVAELCANLIDDIVGKLDASAASFGADMESVDSLVAECERERSGYLGRPGSGRVQVDVASYNDSSNRYLAGKRNALAIAKRMAEQVHGLDESFKKLSKLLSRFQTIVVASRIEVAKTHALAAVANTVAGMIELTDQIESDVGEAMSTTKDFIQIASAAIGEYSESATREDARLVEALRGVEDDIRGLEGARAAVDRAIEAFSVYTPDFIALASEAGRELAELRSLAAALGSARSHLLELRDDVTARMPPGTPPPDAGRLEKMVERFTIFTHKKAAGAIGSFKVEEGVEAGEVTLF